MVLDNFHLAIKSYQGHKSMSMHKVADEDIVSHVEDTGFAGDSFAWMYQLEQCRSSQGSEYAQVHCLRHYKPCRGDRYLYDFGIKGRARREM